MFSLSESDDDDDSGGGDGAPTRAQLQQFTKVFSSSGSDDDDDSWTKAYIRKLHSARAPGKWEDVFEVSADIPSSLKPKTAIHKARSRRASLATSVNPAVVVKKQEMLAMKCLRPQIRSNCDQFVTGAEDLVHETAMLASLDHPFIIKLHARASGSLRDSFVLNDGYFILLDRLTGFLTDRLQEWKCVAAIILLAEWE
ncbi:hypothetical protein THAOC_01662 [Thalassiosira oceanica]|uniref:Protein kinase domain-containing protein n=1 Tax=Thalassiosira oceanica TaxID=159749 RepID=K0TCZ1_THAOC|nr:hypothetical protein THAOC_01662 [Thalassiosira oceanica]|eukprot:EJK76573.1 hypothetical protein THAOC_01662 [Thalassiosira oceanica]